MERQKEKTEVVHRESKEKAGKELEELKKELAELKKLKEEKQALEREATQKDIIKQEDTKETDLDYIEEEFDKLQDLLSSQLGKIDQKAYEKQAAHIEEELQTLEEEIIGEKGLIEKKLTAHENLIEAYPWLEEERKKFMYSMPDKTKNNNDYHSWKSEWAKVLLDPDEHYPNALIDFTRLF